MVRLALWLVIAFLLASGGVVAQAPSQPTIPTVPPTAPRQVPQTVPQMAPPPPAPPDTALVRLAGPSDWPAPTAIHVWPDTLVFGGQAAVVLDFTREPSGFAADSLRCDVDWLVPATQAGSRRHGLAGFWDRLTRRVPQVDLDWTDLPAAAGWRVAVPIRFYRVGTCRFVWSENGAPASSFVHVVGRVSEPGQAAVIRPPRGLGWHGARIAAGFLVVVLLTVLVWWLWQRRRRPSAGPVDTPLPLPAYLDTAVRLGSLHAAQLPARGEGRAFLDRLGECVRGFLSQRYLISAGELTPGEIRTVLEDRGHRPAMPREFARVLLRADNLRFSRQAIDAEFCRQQLIEVMRLIAASRVVARFTPVPPERLLAGDKAWAKLCADLGLNHQVGSQTGGGA